MLSGNSDVKMIKIIQLFSIFTPAITITSLHIRTFMNPCTPFLPGYFILPECSQIPAEDSALQLQVWITWVAVRALMCAFLYYILIDTIGFYCIVCLQFLLIQVHCIRSHLNRFINSIEIQLQPNRNISQIDLTVYRELQILTIYYNKIQQDAVIICVVNHAVFVLVLCSYALISEREGLTYLQTILLVCVAMDGFLLITVSFRDMAKLYAESVEVKQLIDSRLVVAQINKCNRKMTRMYSRSFRLLMIKVGTVFFFDRMTTFNILNFCINALVNMLLLI